MWTKNKGDTNSNRGKWNQLKVIQKRAEQYTKKTQNELQKIANFVIEHIF
jgi:hypothetical protein